MQNQNQAALDTLKAKQSFTFLNSEMGSIREQIKLSKLNLTESQRAMVAAKPFTVHRANVPTATAPTAPNMITAAQFKPKQLVMRRCEWNELDPRSKSDYLKQSGKLTDK